MRDFLLAFGRVLAMMAPWLLCGFPLSGIVAVCLPREWVVTAFSFSFAFGPDKCNNGCTRFLVARRVSVVGFLSGGRIIGAVSEGF